MNKSQALNAFWNSFGIKAYEENTVPKSAQDANDGMYIAYEVSLDSFPNTSVLAASLYDVNSTRWNAVEEKAAEISAGIGDGGRKVVCETGKLWIKRGTPFAQHMAGENDTTRRIYMTIEVDFLTAD